MINLQDYLETKVCDAISGWINDGIYAISFFVYSNEANKYREYSNVTEFYVGYNTESDCEGADELSEERWNYAFWRQEGIPIIKADDEDEGIKVLFAWYEEKNIRDIGFEDYRTCYDDKMRYIGKGPVGYYELLTEIITVAEKLQANGFIDNKFGKKIPIIIHDLEYPWYIFEANKKVNSRGEADSFFKAMEKLGFSDAGGYGEPSAL